MNHMQNHWLSRQCLVCFAGIVLTLCASEVSEDDILFAAGKWLENNTVFWGAGELPAPSSAKRLADDDGNPLPLWMVGLSPRGYIVFSSDDKLPPVVAFNNKGGISKIPETLSLMLARQAEIFQNALTVEKTRGDSAATENLELWNALLSRTRAESITPSSITRQPMLSTEWEQDAPFNTFCPNELTSNQRAVTGCVAVAVGQVMKFHEWPPVGTGTRENTDAKGDIKATIKADYSFPYNWDSIPDASSSLVATSDAIPLARLLMDAGTLGSADYEIDGTSAYSSSINKLLPEHLGYSSAIVYGDTRKGYEGYTSQATLYSRIKKDMVEARPAIVSFDGHAFVADGLGTSGGQDYYHFNYGWGGLENGWYLLDDGTEVFGGKTFVISATTNIIPNAIPVFRPISVEQDSSFTLAWDFPKRITAQAFRLSKSTGTRVVTPISDAIPGDARSFELTGQSGTCTYTLEAKVDGKWQAASSGVTITVKESPAPLPTIDMAKIIMNIAGEETTATITSSTTLKSLSVTSSRPDILPDSGITISGRGSSRTIKFKVTGEVIGNVLLNVTATDDAGNTVKQHAMLRVIQMNPLADAAAIATGEDISFYSSATPWFLETKTFNSAPSAMQSGSIGDSDSTMMLAKVTGPGIISFSWKASCEKVYDKLTFSIDGEAQDTITGRTAWLKKELYVAGNGEHYLSWDYEKDMQDSANEDCGWVDDIVWTPDRERTVDGIDYWIKGREAIITGVVDTEASTLEIPVSVDDFPVTGIADDAFAECKSLALVYTDNEVVLDWFAANMPEVALKGTIRHSEAGLSYYVMRGEVAIIGFDEETIDLLIPAELDGCPVTKLEFGDITNENVKRISLSATVTDIGDCCASKVVFLDWSALESISVAEGNPAFASKDGVLYNTDFTTIIRFPLASELTEFVVPDTVKTLIDRAFFRNRNLKTLVLSSSISNLGESESVFFGCCSLETLTIPDGIEVIGESMFDSCGALEEIHIGKDVTTIKEKAFYGCESIWTVFSDSETVRAWFAANVPDVLLKGALRHSDAGLIYYVLNGEVAIYDFNRDATEIDIPAELEGYPVTKLEFTGYVNDKVETVSFPASVTDIGENGPATGVCLDWYALKRIIVAEGNPAYASKDGVLYSADFTKLILFPFASEIVEFVVPDSVKLLGGSAFCGSINLKKVVLSSSITNFAETRNVFFGCPVLENVIIPDGIDGIGESMFSYSKALKTIYIGDDVASIHDDAFDNCEGLATVYTDSEFVKNWFAEKMPDVALLDVPRVTSHGVIYRLFGGEAMSIGVEDNEIEEVVIPTTVEECPVAIDDKAFDGCDNLKRAYTDNEAARLWFAENMPDVIVSPIPTNGDTVAADGILYLIQDDTAIVMGHEDRSVTDVTIHSIVAGYSVVAIDDEAFMGFENLACVVIPNGVTAIGDEAFAGCGNLVNLTLPEDLLSIGDSAFEFCERMAPVTLPASLETIGDSAFWGCTEWTAIEVAEGNEHFATINGVLYNADKTDMLMYPAGRKDIVMTIPDGVTNVSASFYYPENPLRHFLGVIVGNDLTDPQSLENVFGDYEGAYYNEDGELIPFTQYYLPKLKFVQTDNEAVVAWLAENRPELVVMGMDAEQPVRIVEEDGLSFLINNGEAMLCAADEAMVNAVIPAAIDDVPVTSINDWAFQKMPNLESVSIPATVTEELGEWIFDGSPKLQVVDIAEENPLYASLDGIVYTADFTTLIFYPRGREDATFVVERVEAIDEFAFDGATALTGVTILDSVVTIYTCAFYGCTSLLSLTVGDGVDYIVDGAFDKCDALATVYTDNLYVIDWFTEHRPDVELLSLPRVTENGLTYRVLNGEATLIGVEDDDVEEIVIPTTVEDYPVIAIGDTAFDECGQLKTVYTDNEIAKLWFAENMPDVNVIQITGIVVDCEFAAGWNLITPTLLLDDDSVGELLDANAMVLDSANSTYRRASADDIVAGAALWIFVIEPLEMELCGDYIFDWELQVNSGWNLFGAVKDVTKEEMPENVESVWEWNGSVFKECESMKQGKAYWIFGK